MAPDGYQSGDHDRLVIAERDILDIRSDLSEIKGDVKMILGYVSGARSIGLAGARTVSFLALVVGALALALRFVHI